MESKSQNIVSLPPRYSITELADILQVHRTTLQKSIARGTCSIKLAVRLEKLLRVDRQKFIWPDKYGDPWKIVLRDGRSSRV